MRSDQTPPDRHVRVRADTRKKRTKKMKIIMMVLYQNKRAPALGQTTTLAEH